MYKYQANYSKINPNVLNEKGRIQKAKKIQRVLADFLKKNRIEGFILDIGCSGGTIINHLSFSEDKKIGMDIDIDALKKAHKNENESHIDFICADGMNIPIKDSVINLVLCNHVYEHVPDSNKLFNEIFRILANKGICYCAAGNALMLMEAHYNLPFLSWLPKCIAHIYVRMAHRGNYYYENLLTWWTFKKRIQKFTRYDYSISIIRNPHYFEGNDLIKSGAFLTRIPPSIYKYLYPFLPTWVIILEKIED